MLAIFMFSRDINILLLSPFVLKQTSYVFMTIDKTSVFHKNNRLPPEIMHSDNIICV